MSYCEDMNTMFYCLVHNTTDEKLQAIMNTCILQFFIHIT